MSSSLRTLLSVVALGLISLPSSTNAIPQNVVTTTVTVTNCAATPSADPVNRVFSPPTVTLPLNGGPSELPQPPSNLTLKFITLGRGNQNYTCAPASSSTPTPIPVSIGAVATLFDFTSLAFSSPSLLNILPAAAVNMPITIPTPITTPSTSLPIGEALELPNVGTFAALGTHYFDATGTPTFNLSAVNNILFGAKKADIKAPAAAIAGPNGTGSVDWLALGDKSGSGSVGVQMVYRVVTAGGNAPKDCSGLGSAGGVLTAPYAAQYWFFGLP